MTKRLFQGILLIAVTSALMGCGSSGSGGKRPASEPVFGQAVLGPLAGADVQVFIYTDLDTPILTATTEDSTDLAAAGRFEIPADLLEDDQLYVIAVSGGNDIDADDDGVVDDTATANAGTIHLAASGSQIMAGDFKVNILTDALYHKIAYMILAGYDAADILATMDQYVSALVRSDVNGDTANDMMDLLAFDPAVHQDAAATDWIFWQAYIAQIHAGLDISVFLTSIRPNIIATVGQVRPLDVCIVGSTAYLADMNHGLYVVDISDPYRPEVLGNANTSTFNKGVDVAGNYAYMASEGAGLQVVDITDPENPDAIEWSGPTAEQSNVVVDQEQAFVALKAGGVQVYDISNPAVPGFVRTIATTAAAYGVGTSGNYLLASGEMNLQIFDISNVATPDEQPSVDKTTKVNDLVVVDNMAYLGSSLRGLQIVDITDPAAAELLSTTPSVGPIQDVAASAGRAYLAEGSSGLEIMEVTLSGNSTSLKDLKTIGRAQGVAYADPFVYVADPDGGLLVIDPQGDMANRAVVGAMNGQDIEQITIKEDYAFATNGGSSVVVVNIGDPTNPELGSPLNLTGVLAQDIDCAGDHAFVVGSEQFIVVDTSNPQNIVEVTSLDTAIALGTDARVGIGEGVAVVAGDQNIQVIDITNPSLPDGDANATVAASGNVEDLVVAGSFAYAAIGFDGLLLVDVSDPETPGAPVELDLDGFSYGVAIAGNYAYVANAPGGLQVVDISNPAEPAAGVKLPLPGQAQKVDIDGTYAYVALENTGVCIVDINDPTDPRVVGFFNTHGNPQGIRVDNGYVYVGAQTAGMQVLRAIP